VCANNKMKNRDAPFMWIIRVTHPIELSRMMFTIASNALEVSAVNIIDRTSPEMICSISVKPNMKPIFHIMEIEIGAGRSKRDFF